MYFTVDWNITIGDYNLLVLEKCEIHKSVDILADTCVITLPGYTYDKAFRIEETVKRGDLVVVQAGLNGALVEEFRGYLLYVGTDSGDLTINCEDELFVLRKSVADKSFKNTTLKEIAQYIIDQTGTGLSIDSTLDIVYDKFVISNATAYDVLKKIKEETKASIYLRFDANKKGVLHLHPPYTEKHGSVRYSFQENIEEDDLKYRRMDDKQIEVVVEGIGADGKKVQVTSGTTGGDKITIKGRGLSKESMKKLADNEYRRQLYDGYEGSITTWLIPYVEPGYSAQIKDEDYEYKDGWYYTTAVTTTIDANGGDRSVQLGIKVADNG